MLSFLTLTYHRSSLLEEAIFSFLSQDNYNYPCEMVIVNDSNLVDYTFDKDPRVRVINHRERFSSISKKIEFGYKQCGYDYIYRLDDDDLLAPNAINIVQRNISLNPGYEIYRSKFHYFFSNSKFIKLSDNINNGNVYSRLYFNRIKFPNKTSDEDVELTFGHGARIFHYDPKDITMIYRWGTGDYHISGIGTGETVFEKVDKIAKIETGTVELKPKFLKDYYEQLPK